MTLTSVNDEPAAVPAPAPSGPLPPALLAKLAEPGVAESLTSLLSHADLIAILVEGLDGLVGRSEVIGDSIVSSIAEVQAGVSVDPDLAGELGKIDLPALTKSALRLAAIIPQAAPGLADAAATGAVDELALLGHGLVKGHEQFERSPVEIGGAFSLLKLLKDPDINRALSYFATVAKAVGQELGK